MAGATLTTGRGGGDLRSWGRALALPSFCLQKDELCSTLERMPRYVIL